MALCAAVVLGFAAAAAADLGISLPVNLTALRRRPSSPLGLGAGLRRLYDGAIGLLANTTVDCVPRGRLCVPDTGSCCEGLRCAGGGVSEEGERGSQPWSCRGPDDSDQEAGDRLDALRQDDGGAASHPWAYSWEFQSRSEMEREEMAAAEEVEWKRNWKPKEGEGNAESKWAKLKEKIKQKTKNAWQSLKTWKKLNELRGKIIEKYKRAKPTKKDDVNSPDDVAEKSEAAKKQRQEEGSVSERSRKIIKFDSSAESYGFFANSLGNADEVRSSVERSAEQKPESEESVIKFSDEMPKKRKKIDFRIDDIIRDGVDMIAEKIKAKTKSKDRKGVEISPGTSLEKQLYEREEIDDTENRLMKEIEELKKLRKSSRGEREKVRERTDEYEPNVDELIKRQVETILEEERKLERLRKIEELKRMEQGLSNNRVNK